MARPDRIELAGTAEIAALLGVSRQRVDQLAKRAGFPEPLAHLDAGRIWDLVEIRDWMSATGR